MRTPHRLYPETKTLYACELEACPVCGGSLEIVYTSGSKVVQTMTSMFAITHQPKRCVDANCGGNALRLQSVRWLQTAPRHCTYGFDVIAQIGWQRQVGKETFGSIHSSLTAHLQIGEPQLWVVRELLTGITLRSGWLAQQDESTFVHFLQPIADLGLSVQAVLSDKQRGLVPAVAAVFPNAKPAWCQTHYLRNAAEPVANADESMKITLRQCVRAEIGVLIRQEKMEQVGVLTVTGGLPSPMTPEHGDELPVPASQTAPATVAQECEAIRQDLRRRIRYLLTLKGRPPLRLAGVEMFERLREVCACLERLLTEHDDPQLLHLHQGLQTALQSTQATYELLRQAADWLEHIAYILDPQDHPTHSGSQVRQELFDYLDTIRLQSQDTPRLAALYQPIYRTTCNYAPGLFHTYDIPGLPRTNNARESEFRDLNRRLLATIGQKGLVKRIIQRQGAWEVIPRPTSLEATVQALSRVPQPDFLQERQRVRAHRNRFRLHTRSAKQALSQLKQLEQRWTNLHATNTS